jgi:putative membrane protein
MLLILCVDRDDDLGAKAGIETPLVGRDAVGDAARRFGVADPEDSDLNALYQALKMYDETDERAEIAVVTGSTATHRNGDRAVAAQVDEVLEDVEATSTVVVTDGAEDEGIIPIIESRLRIDGVSRTVVKQAENLENAYHVLKRLLDDPDTRGTVLVPIGIVLLIFPIDVIMNLFDLPNAALGITAGLLGSYFLMKGLGMDDDIERLVDAARDGIYSGKVSLITYLVAAGLVVIGGASGLREVQQFTEGSEAVIEGAVPVAMAFAQGAVVWLTAGGVVSSAGRIVDEYIQRDEFPAAYLNGPFYVVSMGLALHAVSGFILGRFDEVYLAVAVVVSVGIGMSSTAVFGGIGRGSVDGEEVAEVE